MTDVEFKLGEHVLLKVKPKKISLKLGSCTKMAARFWKLLKVQWTYYDPEDATWEHEDTMRAECSQIFE
jgi:hypothetical protein